MKDCENMACNKYDEWFMEKENSGGGRECEGEIRFNSWFVTSLGRASEY